MNIIRLNKKETVEKLVDEEINKTNVIKIKCPECEGEGMYLSQNPNEDYYYRTCEKCKGHGFLYLHDSQAGGV